VCAYVYRATGGAGLRAGSIQRCFRDVNAAIQHLIVSTSGAPPAVSGSGWPTVVWRHRELIPAHG